MADLMSQLTTRLRFRQWQGPVVCAMAVGSASSWASAGQTALADPMRPSASVQTFSASPTAKPGSDAPAVSTTLESPRLQATRRNDKGVWIALIDERWRSIGERHGQATVAAIRAGDVVLTEGSQRLTLTLQGASPAATDSGRLTAASPVLNRLNQDRPVQDRPTQDRP